MEIGSNDSGKMIKNDLYSSCDTNSSKQPQQQMVIINSEQLDIEEHAALYSGRTKIMRLLFIGEKCQNVSMQLEAFRMACDEIKKGEDINLFKEVVQKIDGRLGPEYGLDLGWIESVYHDATQTKENLEKKINFYMKVACGDRLRNLCWCKDGLRIGYNNFGDFHYARGALGDAFKNYERAEDCCGHAKHSMDIYLKAILVSIEMGNFTNVLKYVGKVTESKFIFSNCITLVKLQCAAGLAHLGHKQYKHAAKKFVEAPDLVDSYPEVIASPDVAKYGGLCALASFDRAEMKANVIDNMNFNKYLDLVPKVRELIHDFYSSRYASCLDNLANLKPNLLLDIHLHDHVEILYTQIRNKALIQYTLPYVSLDMNLMATAFKTTVVDLQKELETLITENQIQAKIDSVNKVLYAGRANKRNSVFGQVLQTGSELERDARAMLYRFKLTKSKYDRRA